MQNLLNYCDSFDLLDYHSEEVSPQFSSKFPVHCSQSSAYYEEQFIK